MAHKPRLRKSIRRMLGAAYLCLLFFCALRLFSSFLSTPFLYFLFLNGEHPSLVAAAAAVAVVLGGAAALPYLFLSRSRELLQGSPWLCAAALATMNGSCTPLLYRTGLLGALVPFCVAALNAHGAASRTVCEEACSALCTIAASDAGKAACAAARAPRAIAAALAAHAADERVCEEACRAIQCIASHSEAGRAACVAARAPRFIVAALAANVGAAEACEEACSALGKIASGEEGRAACVAAGASATLVAVLKAHAGLQPCLQAVAALGNIAANSKEGKASCVAALAPAAIVAALGVLGGAAAFCKQACRALCNIAGSAGGKAACLAVGAVLALEAVRTTHPQQAALCAHAESALLAVTGRPACLYLASLPPPLLAARLGSCLECWRATPRRACPRGDAHTAPHGELRECPICFGAECSEKPWLALRCGHYFHRCCMKEWGKRKIEARAAVLCPLCMCVATRFTWAPAEGEIILAAT